MRQYRCSEIFKEKILHLFLSEPLKWEDGYLKSLKECEDLFVESAKGYQIPLINKTLFSAKNELVMVLKDYYADLKASPARELNSLDHIEKDINKTGSRSSQMVVGFALTSAIRLRGYGNFQFVSSYAYGPHIFNFSCINDRSTLENETMVRKTIKNTTFFKF
jgi:sulfur relay (sulfurtransferase) DsrC/TusE family protein